MCCFMNNQKVTNTTKAPALRIEDNKYAQKSVSSLPLLMHDDDANGEMDECDRECDSG